MVPLHPLHSQPILDYGEGRQQKALPHRLSQARHRFKVTSFPPPHLEELQIPDGLLPGKERQVLEEVGLRANLHSLVQVPVLWGGEVEQTGRGQAAEPSAPTWLFPLPQLKSVLPTPQLTCPQVQDDMLLPRECQDSPSSHLPVLGVGPDQEGLVLHGVNRLVHERVVTYKGQDSVGKGQGRTNALQLHAVGDTLQEERSPGACQGSKKEAPPQHARPPPTYCSRPWLGDIRLHHAAPLVTVTLKLFETAVHGSLDVLHAIGANG